MKPPRHPRLIASGARRRRRAFSLVEVTLALGVIGFGCVALIGLIPTGLNVFRESISASVESKIIEAVSSAAQQTKFAALDPSFNNKTVYFTDEGVELAPGVPREQSNFSAVLSVSPKTDLAGLSQGVVVSQSQSLATIGVTIYWNKGRFDANGPVDASPVRRFVYVANMGK